MPTCDDPVTGTCPWPAAAVYSALMDEAREKQGFEVFLSRNRRGKLVGCARSARCKGKG